MTNKYEENDRKVQEIEGKVDASVVGTVFFCYLFYVIKIPLFLVIHVLFVSLFCRYFFLLQTYRLRAVWCLNEECFVFLLAYSLVHEFVLVIRESKLILILTVLWKFKWPSEFVAFLY